MKKENFPEEHSLASPQICKGLALLQSVSSRGSHGPERKLLGDQHRPSKSAQAISRYYRKVSQLKKLTNPNGFMSEMEEMRKAFLMRPGCPQFSTRATSVSHMGSATTVDLPRDLCSSSGTWRMAEDEPLVRHGSATSMDGHPFSFSKSACELTYSQDRSETPATSSSSSSTMVKTSQRTRVPWYISVIHEKDHSLVRLGEELRRLSVLETQMQKKDQQIVMLQKEKEALKKQLKILLRSKGPETSSASIRMDRSFEAALKLGRLSMLKSTYKEEEELQRWMQMQMQDDMVENRELPMEIGSIVEEKGPEGPSEEAARSRSSMAKRGTLHEVDKEEEEEEAKGAEEEEEEVVEEEEPWELREEEEEHHPRKSYSLTESFEEELIAQLEEYERMLMDFQSELELTRARYSLATGTITSLQRQTDFQESQLRKVTTENELLEKELRERKQQIQTMTNKFSSLREEKKQQGIMGLIEKENFVLRQQVSDLEAELLKRDQAITELHSKTSELQAQVALNEDHLRRWKELHDDLQSRNETIQQAEQQTRVVLESCQARLEKLRNKIIQGIYSMSGTKSFSTELSDTYILESLQRIITERTDFYSQLKQKGVKVPPLQQSDISLPSKIKKLSTKPRPQPRAPPPSPPGLETRPRRARRPWRGAQDRGTDPNSHPGLPYQILTAFLGTGGFSPRHDSPFLPEPLAPRSPARLLSAAAGGGGAEDSCCQAAPRLAGLVVPATVLCSSLSLPASLEGSSRPYRLGRGGRQVIRSLAVTLSWSPRTALAASPDKVSFCWVGEPLTPHKRPQSEKQRAYIPEAPLEAYSMQSQESGVHYSRWDNSSRDEVSMTAMSSTEEASCLRRLSQKLCSGKLGIAMKVLGGVALFWIIFILGYVTGYYVHKCK